MTPLYTRGWAVTGRGNDGLTPVRPTRGCGVTGGGKTSITPLYTRGWAVTDRGNAGLTPV